MPSIPEQNNVELRIESVVSVVVDRVGVHVTDAEDVDQQAEEGCHEQEHHGDVINVDAEAELIGGLTPADVPSQTPEVNQWNTESCPACTEPMKSAIKRQGEHEHGAHDSKGNDAPFLDVAFFHVGFPLNTLPEEEDDRKGNHRQEHDEGRQFGNVWRCDVCRVLNLPSSHLSS